MADDCRNCKWAAWKMTNHNPPRINTRIYGKCEFVVQLPILPKVLTDDKRYLTEHNFNDFRSRTIWANSAYTDCPVWTPKEGLKP